LRIKELIYFKYTKKKKNSAAQAEMLKKYNSEREREMGSTIKQTPSL